MSKRYVNRMNNNVTFIESQKSTADRYNQVFAQDAITYSRKPDRYIGNAPKFIKEMPLDTNDFFLDENNNRYYDFAGGMGAINYTSSNMSSIPTLFELDLAEKLQERIPILQRLKFLKTGSEACLAAVRIARAYTGKHKVFGVGYHGWGDLFAMCLRERGGVETCVCNGGYTKYDTFDELLGALGNLYVDDLFPRHDIAAIIIEPVELNLDIEDKLKKIREECDRLKIVLIYDEIITGYRFPKYCVTNYFAPKPDILCLGKSIADGFPLSVVGGREKIMNTDTYFISSTFAGEVFSIKMALSVLDFVTEKRLQKLWNNGKKFMETFNELSQDIQLKGYNTRAQWHGNDERIFVFMQEMVKKGFLLGTNFFYSFYVERSIEKFFDAAKKTIADMRTYNIKLDNTAPINFRGRA